MKKNLHLVAFDVPYPPKYGGIIDIFYKIVELHKLGINIHLHIFADNNAVSQKELKKYCANVYYYQRKSNFWSLFSTLPMRVKSRNHKNLLTNLNAVKAPIIFEGLHAAYLLNTNSFTEKTYVRAHNIEHLYFYGLAKSEKNILKKIFFYIEGFKLKHFEKTLRKTNGIFTISPTEQAYFLENYGEKATYIPAFHRSDFKEHKTQKGKFVLWHGDLRISDNSRVANELIDTFKNFGYKLVIASSFEEKSVLSNINLTKNIDFVNITHQDILDDLLEKAHVNILLTHQKTGIKLKLLYSLYQGKFAVANDKMIDNTGLESLCEKANTTTEILEKTQQLFKLDFTQEIVEKRKEVLANFSPKKAAQKIIDVIFT